MKSLLIVFLLIIVSPFHSQTSKISGDPVPNIEVTLKQTNNGSILKRTITNAMGLFEFSNLTDGKYVVDFSVNEGAKKIVQQDLQMNIEVKNTTERRNKIMDHLMARESKTMSVSVSISGYNVRGTISTSRSNIKKS